MKKESLFNVVGSVLFALSILWFGVHVFHVDQKVDHISRPAKLFGPHHIESTKLSKFDFPNTMSHDLNKFCYLFCQQPLFWLAKGEHAYIFETKDGRHVVKFLSLRLPQKQVRTMALSAQLAFDVLPEETGMLFLHLNRTTRVARGVMITDFYGQQHRICGDNTRFIVQKKAAPFFPTLATLIEEGRIEEAKKRIDQVIELLRAVASKNISDGLDAFGLNDSIGFTSERAIYVDTWNFYRVPFIDVHARMRYEFYVRLNPLKKWLDIVSPELAAYFRSKREGYAR